MANSSIIGISKNKIIKELIKDKDILEAIGSNRPNITAEKYIGTHIFDYHLNPNTLNTVDTFITIQVNIPNVSDSHKKFVNASVEIWIISHQKHMIVTNVPKISENRNDYISELIDKKLNGTSGYGIGELRLVTNVENAFQKDYLYRQMIFRTVDINESLCEDE